MSIKTKKTIIYSAFFAMLAAAFYIIFFANNYISSFYYRVITIASLVLSVGVFAFLIIKRRTSDKKNIKLAIKVCLALVAFMLVTLPIVNIYSQSLPFWPPRGTVYQYTGSNSISQNEVSLMMRYYLDGKTLYANEDYPLNAHNGEIFITDEYDFVEGDYIKLTKEESQAFYEDNKSILMTKHVQWNPKLKLEAHNIYLSINESDEVVIILDEGESWFVITKEHYEEAFGE